MTDLQILGIGISLYKNSGISRFQYYCESNNLSYQIIGLGKKWLGGDMSLGPGGGQKIIETLNFLQNIPNQLIVICDTFDLIPITSFQEIIDKYHILCPNSEILFSSEIYCWPKSELSIEYPNKNTKYKYLNSGGIMGYRDDIYHLIKNAKINYHDDDQLYYTYQFFNNTKIKLDYDCHIFQTLNGCHGDIVIHKNRIFNKYTNSYPIFIHGNGVSKSFLNHIENYIPAHLHNYSQILVSPSFNNKVFLACYLNSHHNITEFITSINKIKYSNLEIHIYDENYNQEFHDYVLKMNYHYHISREYTSNHFFESDCEYYFIINEWCILNNFNIINDLLKYSNYRDVIAPMLKNRHNITLANFHSKIINGEYVNGIDYSGIISGQWRGIWNVACVKYCMMMSRNLLQIIKINGKDDMLICKECHDNTYFIYLVNDKEYGFYNIH